MELSHLKQFIAIAHAGHITRAAGVLGLTQPALSATLRKLEAELGAELVHRTGRGVQLTEAGRVFLTHAQDTLRRAEAGAAAVRQLVGLEHGSIRVGGGATATSFLLPPVVSRVRRAHPGLRFYVREGGSSAIADSVLSGELDLGIVTLPVIHPEADALQRTPLATDELRLIVPPAHPLSGRPTFRWKEIREDGVVAFEAGTAVRNLIDRAAADAGVSLDVVMELRSIESIKRMVAAGVGVGFVSRFALTGEQGLACKDARLTRGLAIIRRRDRKPSAAVAAFEAALTEFAADRGRTALRAIE